MNWNTEPVRNDGPVRWLELHRSRLKQDRTSADPRTRSAGNLDVTPNSPDSRLPGEMGGAGDGFLFCYTVKYSLSLSAQALSTVECCLQDLSPVQI